MVAASLIGLYFRAELATYVKRSAGEHDAAGIGTVGAPVAGQEALANELARAQQVIETQVALASKTRGQAAQLKQAADSATAELRQSLQKEHDRAEALASELARTRRDIETQTTLPSKTRDNAAQLKQAAKNATAELRLTLQKEHDRAEALAASWRKRSGTSRRRLRCRADGRRGGAAQATQAGFRERNSGAATVSAEGARQGRGAGERAGKSAAGHRDAGCAGEQDG